MSLEPALLSPHVSVFVRRRHLRLKGRIRRPPEAEARGQGSRYISLFATGAFDFFADTYDTERLKTLSVWSQIPDGQMQFRPEPRARSPLEHMVHQCMSEDGWMKNMLGIDVGLPALPAEETRLAFISHYAAVSAARLEAAAAEARRLVPGADDLLRHDALARLGAGRGASRTRPITAGSSPPTCGCGDSRCSRPMVRRPTPAACPRTARRSSIATTRSKTCLPTRGATATRTLPGTGSAPPTERP